jgi:transposase
MPMTRIRAMSQEEVGTLYERRADGLAARLEFELIGHLDASVQAIEKEVLQTVALWPAYRHLQSIPGIGEILGMTITMETGDLGRFASAGNYASYARCVDSKRETNGKKKGRNNSKCGNKYLGWAFVEAAQFARRYNLQCRQFYDRKCAQANSIVATKALACKLAKAAYHVMKEQTPFKLEKVFPKMKIKKE